VIPIIWQLFWPLTRVLPGTVFFVELPADADCALGDAVDEVVALVSAVADLQKVAKVSKKTDF
jgi:hypothetical protein